ncbi:hypothetical protein GCM10027404_01020 [Arthrobacter tumbae]|uniref:hypothetical protein n=1 Tax=Arthrobacter tumbae TaxID=163874 RepID=UPI00195DD9D4|nr:hypothetical protein [Arthrobacter tumbae]MBM7780454.1 hypothetical protein [Arthrobacter tumbae]
MGKAEERVIRSYLRRIETLAKGSSKRGFLAEGLQSFIDHQSQVAELQRDIQREIAAVKPKARRDRALIAHLRELRVVRWHSRRVGDGLAWRVLLHDKQAIYALGKNARVPLAPKEDDGSRGVGISAANFLNEGWGLPIIHDITDCLRIGDLTLLSFGDDSSERFFRTLEIKTTRISQTEGDDGSVSLDLRVSAIGTESFPEVSARPIPELKASPIPQDTNASTQKRREDRRIPKQFERMVEAVAYRTAEADKVNKIGDTLHLALEADYEEKPHWAELRRTIREARREGFSYFSIDEFVGYGIWYNAQGLEPGDVKKYDLNTRIQQSIVKEALGERNRLTIQQIPIAEDNEFARFVLPFTAYDIPHRAISDMLHGRLLIAAFVNTGVIEQALEGAGFTVLRRPGKDDPRSFTLRGELHWPTGEAIWTEIPAPWVEIWSAVHEFLALESIISKSSTILALPTKIPFEDFSPEKLEASMAGEEVSS